MSFGFGASANPSGSTGFGGFGASNPTGGFGAAAQPGAASPFGGGTTSAFGAAPSAFGSNPGATSAFGTAKSATSGFGGFGSAPASTFGAQPASTGFGSAFGTGSTTTTGGFGAATNPSTGFGAPSATSGGFGSGTSAFGGGGGGGFGAAASPFGPKPTASASPFGSTSVFGGGATQPATSAFGGGSTSGFGSGTSAFGTPAPAASTGSVFGSAFGSAAKSPFGSTASTSAFGAPASTGFGGAFGAAPGGMGGAPQVGTGNPPYQSTHEAEPTGTGTGSYITISKMPAYSHKSVEELRYEDYLKRTDPAAAAAAAALNAPSAAVSSVTGAGAFGSAPSAFGAPTAQPATSSAFGSTGGFGSATSAFGSTPSTSAFGASSTGGFGATTPGATSAFGGFGSQAAAGAAGGSSLFGGAARPVSGFGTPSVSQPMSSGFGAPATSGFGATTGGAAGGFGSTGGFGSSFGATSTPQPQSGFGGFGATTAPASGGFGSTSAFAKPATSSGFGGFGTTPAAAPTTSSFSSFGAPAQPAATPSLFGGSTGGATGGSSFSFGATAPKPAASTSFGFGGTGSGGSFGSATGGGFGSTGGTSAFGTSTSQPLGSTSLFGSTPAVGGSTGGFGFGSAPAPAAGTSSLFGTKPAGSGLFGSTTSTSGGLFGSASTGSSSLFGTSAGTATGGSTGFGLGGGSFGNTSGGFGGFGSTGAASATPQLGFGSSGGSLFGAAQPQAQAAPAQPQNLVATPDVNPYGAGSFGAGLVEQNVNAALGLQTIKTGSSASRLSSFTDDIGLPRGPMESPLSTRRQLVTGRSSVPVSFIRSTFKGSKNRFASFSTGSLVSGSILRSGSDSDAAQEEEFKFSSSLFRNSVAKKLVIDKTEQSRADSSSRANGSRASVIPCVEDERSDINDISSSATRSRVLKPDYDGNYPVLFRNLTNRKSFTLRLHGHSTIKNARDEVKQLLRSTTSQNSVSDIELVWKGRIVQDSITVEELRLKEGDIVDVVVIEDHEQEEKKSEEDTPSSHSLLLRKKQELKSSDEAAKAGKRFMSYDDFLSAAIREEEDGEGLHGASARTRAPSSSSCPVLKKEDYYTVPSYDSLQRMTDSELSQVEGFTVGCRGLGSVEWIGKTDVRHLNLDELVFFERKEVIVYKDDEHKHELGTGLNRPAIVELLGIFPPLRSISADGYRERVKGRTHAIGATFLDYSAANGIWRFRVEHFSRYGFDDDEEEDDMEGDVDMDNGNAPGPADANTKNAPEMKMATVGRSFAAYPSSAVFASERAGILRKSAMYGDAGATSRTAVASFWDPAATAPSEAGYATRMETNSVIEHAPASSFDLGVDEPEPSVAPLKTSDAFPVDSALPVKPLGVDNDTMSISKGSKSTTYQMMLQVSSQKTSVVRNHVDAGMFMARSFRCSWGPNGELVNVGKLLSGRKERPEERTAHRVCIEFPLQVSEGKKSLVKQGLELHYECSTKWKNASQSKGLDFIEGEGATAPSVCPPEYSLPSDDNLVRCLHKYVDFAETVLKQNPRSSFHQNSALLWKLVQALWGQEYGVKDAGDGFSRLYPLAARDDVNESENLETFQAVDLRREAISKWFEETLLTIYSSGDDATDTESPSQSGVLRLICQHRIAEAAEMAMECGDFRLSTLISQALTYEGSDFRSLLVNQLSQWNENGTIEYMEPELVLVYSLLAGSVEVLTAQQGENIPWMVCLALFLWFKRGPATSLKSAVTVYMDAVAKRMASAPGSRFADKKDDLLMEVMKLYIGDAVSLCNVLSPSGFMSERFCHLDYEVSWHLHSVLRAIGYKIDRKWESHIHQNFIRQLEGMGMWEEAAYVALNISSPSERVHTCRGLIFRNADMLLGDAGKRESLCVRLRIPAEWVSEALAVQAVAKSEYHEQIAHWMAARRYEEAHLCLVTHVAPSCLFTGEKEMLLQLLSELEPDAAAISQWQSCVSGYAIGGGLVLEYLRLEKQDGLEVGREEEFLRRVLALSRQLSSIRDSTASNDTPGKMEKTERLVAKTSLASMIVSLATQAVQLQKILSYTQEQQGFSSPAIETPLELRPEFLGGLSNLTSGRETKFVESYRTTQLLNLCSTFLDWRS